MSDPGPVVAGRPTAVSILPELIRASARNAIERVDNALGEHEVTWSELLSGRQRFAVEKRLAIKVATAVRSQPGPVKHVGAIWCDTPAEGSKVLAAHADMMEEPDRLGAAVESMFLDVGRRRAIFARSEGETEILATSIIALSSHTCDGCDGRGNVCCGHCGGRGRVHCKHCQRGGEVSCGGCGGRGRVQRANAFDRNGGAVIIWDNCSLCFGSGRRRCPNCFGSMQLSCNACGGSGALRCGTCVGHGFFSDWFQLSVGATFTTRCEHDLPVLVDRLWQTWVRGGFPKLGSEASNSSLTVERPKKDGDILRATVRISGELETCAAHGRFEEADVQAAAVVLDSPAVAFNAFLDAAARHKATECLDGAASPGEVAGRVESSIVLKAVVEHLATSATQDMAVLETISARGEGSVTVASLADFIRGYQDLKKRFCRRLWQQAWWVFVRRSALLLSAMLVVELVGLVPHSRGRGLTDALIEGSIMLVVAAVPAALAFRSVRRAAHREMGKGAEMAAGMNPVLFPAASAAMAVGYIALSLTLWPVARIPPVPAPTPQVVNRMPSTPAEQSVAIKHRRGNGFVPL